MCWNVYPATAWSSALLWVSHLVLLTSLWANNRLPELAPAPVDSAAGSSRRSARSTKVD